MTLEQFLYMLETIGLIIVLGIVLCVIPFTLLRGAYRWIRDEIDIWKSK